jgi:Leucine-rich repeat (LRR) protein
MSNKLCVSDIDLNQLKIHVYENDLKLKNDNTLEKRLISYNNNNVDNDVLDLSNLNLSSINLLNLKNININNITHLFINSNKLSGLFDVSKLINLITVDICDNNINSLILPKNIQELMFDSNQIEKLPEMKNIKRLKGCNNKLTEINEYPLLEILIISNNNIKILNKCPNLKKLIISDNPIDKLYNLELLEYLDISNTKLKHLNYTFNNLDHLVNNYNQITELPDKLFIPKIKFIENISTPINKIFFYPNFDTILCSINLTKHISSKYKDIANIKVKNNTIICLTRI